MNSKVRKESHYVHFHGAPFRGKILMVVSSPSVSAQTGWPIGFWGAELTHPLWVFQEAGFEVILGSTEGGNVEMDAYSHPLDPSGYAAHDVITLGYLQKEWFQQMLETTITVKDVKASEFDAIFLVGGQAPMYTFRGHPILNALFAQFVESGKPAAAVCHATTLLLEATLQNGESLVKGKTWTGFANSEEDFADQALGMKIQPYRIEDEARKLPDTHFVVAPAFSAHAIASDNLITGQQQNSGALAARFVVDQLEQKL